MDSTVRPTSNPDYSRGGNEHGAPSATTAPREAKKGESSRLRGFHLAHHESGRVSPFLSVLERDTTLDDSCLRRAVNPKVRVSSKFPDNDCALPRHATKGLHVRKYISELSFSKQEDSELGSLLDFEEYKYACTEVSVFPMRGESTDCIYNPVETFRMSTRAPTNASLTNVDINVADASPSDDGLPLDWKRVSSLPTKGNNKTTETPAAQLLKGVRRKVTSETITKTVIERTECVKTVTNRYSGVEEKDVHVESRNKIEEHAKCEEEVVESYNSVPTVVSSESEPRITLQAAQAAVPPGRAPPTLVSSDSTKGGVEAILVTLPLTVSPLPLQEEAKGAAVKDPGETEEAEARGVPKTGEEQIAAKDHPTAKSILKTTPEIGEVTPAGRKLGFQEEEEKPSQEKKEDEEDYYTMYEPSLTRFKNLRRKDSIAVAKVRLLRQQKAEGPYVDVEADGDDADKEEDYEKHLIFKPPTVFDVINEDISHSVNSDVTSPMEQQEQVTGLQKAPEGITDKATEPPEESAATAVTAVAVREAIEGEVQTTPKRPAEESLKEPLEGVKEATESQKEPSKEVPAEPVGEAIEGYMKATRKEPAEEPWKEPLTAVKEAAETPSGPSKEIPALAVREAIERNVGANPKERAGEPPKEPFEAVKEAAAGSKEPSGEIPAVAVREAIEGHVQLTPKEPADQLPQELLESVREYVEAPKEPSEGIPAVAVRGAIEGNVKTTPEEPANQLPQELLEGVKESVGSQKEPSEYIASSAVREAIEGYVQTTPKEHAEQLPQELLESVKESVESPKEPSEEIPTVTVREAIEGRVKTTPKDPAEQLWRELLEGVKESVKSANEPSEDMPSVALREAIEENVRTTPRKTPEQLPQELLEGVKESVKSPKEPSEEIPAVALREAIEGYVQTTPEEHAEERPKDPLVGIIEAVESPKEPSKEIPGLAVLEAIEGDVQITPKEPAGKPPKELLEGIKEAPESPTEPSEQIPAVVVREAIEGYVQTTPKGPAEEPPKEPLEGFVQAADCPKGPSKEIPAVAVVKAIEWDVQATPKDPAAEPLREPFEGVTEAAGSRKEPSEEIPAVVVLEAVEGDLQITSKQPAEQSPKELLEGVKDAAERAKLPSEPSPAVAVSEATEGDAETTPKEPAEEPPKKTFEGIKQATESPKEPLKEIPSLAPPKALEGDVQATLKESEEEPPKEPLEGVIQAAESLNEPSKEISAVPVVEAIEGDVQATEKEPAQQLPKGLLEAAKEAAENPKEPSKEIPAVAVQEAIEGDVEKTPNEPAEQALEKPIAEQQQASDEVSKGGLGEAAEENMKWATQEAFQEAPADALVSVETTYPVQAVHDSLQWMIGPQQETTMEASTSAPRGVPEQAVEETAKKGGLITQGSNKEGPIALPAEFLKTVVVDASLGAPVEITGRDVAEAAQALKEVPSNVAEEAPKNATHGGIKGFLQVVATDETVAAGTVYLAAGTKESTLLLTEGQQDAAKEVEKASPETHPEQAMEEKGKEKPVEISVGRGEEGGEISSVSETALQDTKVETVTEAFSRALVQFPEKDATELVAVSVEPVAKPPVEVIGSSLKEAVGRDILQEEKPVPVPPKESNEEVPTQTSEISAKEAPKEPEGELPVEDFEHNVRETGKTAKQESPEGLRGKLPEKATIESRPEALTGIVADALVELKTEAVVAVQNELVLDTPLTAVSEPPVGPAAGALQELPKVSQEFAQKDQVEMQIVKDVEVSPERPLKASVVEAPPASQARKEAPEEAQKEPPPGKERAEPAVAPTSLEEGLSRKEGSQEPVLMLTYEVEPRRVLIAKEQEPYVPEVIPSLPEQEPVLPTLTTGLREDEPAVYCLISFSPEAEPCKQPRASQEQGPLLPELTYALPEPETTPPEPATASQKQEPMLPQISQESPEATQIPMPVIASQEQKERPETRAARLYRPRSVSEPIPQVLEEPAFTEVTPVQLEAEPPQRTPELKKQERVQEPTEAKPVGEKKGHREEERLPESAADRTRPVTPSDFHVGTEISEISKHGALHNRRTYPSRSIRDVRNVETSVMTSETQEVVYYPTEKVMKKHISEAKVSREKRSYTEVFIEPNPSDTDTYATAQKPHLITSAFDNRRQTQSMSEKTYTDGLPGGNKEQHLKTLAIGGTSLSVLKESEPFRSACTKASQENSLQDVLQISDEGKPLNLHPSFEASTDFAPIEYMTLSTHMVMDERVPAFHSDIAHTRLDVSRIGSSHSDFEKEGPTERTEDFVTSNIHSTEELIPARRHLMAVTQLGSIAACTDMSKPSDVSEISELRSRVDDAGSEGTVPSTKEVGK